MKNVYEFKDLLSQQNENLAGLSSRIILTRNVICLLLIIDACSSYKIISDSKFHLTFKVLLIRLHATGFDIIQT